METEEAAAAPRSGSKQSSGSGDSGHPSTPPADEEKDDGYEKWILGISKPNLMAALSVDLFVYFSGCYLMYTKLAQPICPVVRKFKPRLKGQPCLLEGNPIAEVYAVAETGKKPRIIIYKFEDNPVDENLIHTLKNTAEFEIRAMKFAKNNIIIVLTGTPTFNISVWKWSSEEQILVVPCIEKSMKSDLFLNVRNSNQWVEVGPDYITFFELQQFTENNVIRTEVALPVRQLNPRRPDPLMGKKWNINILSACWTHKGLFYVLDNAQNLYTVELKGKSLVFVGKIKFGGKKTKEAVNKIFPFDDHLGGSVSNGMFLVIAIERGGGIIIKGKINISSGIKRYFQPGSHLNSFIALTKTNNTLEFVENGKVRSVYTINDFVRQNIASACFIEPDSKYLAILSNQGNVTLLESESGNLLTEWELPFPVSSILCHPILPFFAVGTRTGCMVLLDIRDLNQPYIISKHFVSEHKKSCLEQLAFIDFGFFLVAGDSRMRRLYLQYAYTYGEFQFLDTADIPGEILQLNVPPSQGDQRLQVVMRYTKDDACPVILHHYTFETHCFELAASQSVDIAVKCICFSNNFKLQYAYQAEENTVGLIQYAEDMQAGSLKDPEIYFGSELELDINKLVLRGETLFAFGADGNTSVFQAPTGTKPKPMNRFHFVQSHMYTGGGIRDGFVSFDGSQVITLGYDGTLVCIRIAEKPQKLNWYSLGLPNKNFIVYCQMREYSLLNIEEIDPIVRKNDRSLIKVVDEANDKLDARQYKDDLWNTWRELQKLAIFMGKLIDFNETRDPSEQLKATEFNLDTEEEEAMAEMTHNAKLFTKCKMLALNEARYDWAKFMKSIVWDRFEVKGYRFMGFTCTKEVMNYPMEYASAEFEKILTRIHEDRCLELKMEDLDEEIHKIGYQSSKNIVQVLYKKNKRKTRRGIFDEMDDVDDFGGEPKLKKWVDDDEIEEEEEAVEEQREETPPSQRKPTDPDTATEAEELEHPMRFLTPFEARFGDLPEKLRPSEHAGNIIISTAASSITDFDSTRPPSTASASVDLFELGDATTDVEDTEASTGSHKHSAPHSDKDAKVKGKGRGKSAPKKGGKKGVEVVYSRAQVDKVKQDSIGRHPAVISPEQMQGRDYVDITEWEATSDDDEFKELRKRPKSADAPKKKKEKKKKPPKTAATSGGETEESVSTDTDPDEEIADIRHLNYEAMTPEEQKRSTWFDDTFHGSLIFKIMKPNPLLYHQFDVAGRHHVYFQYMMTKGEIIRLKKFFNKEFDEARNLKDGVLKETKKRNKRVRQILEYLNVQLEFGNLSWDPREDSEAFFTCKEREIPVQKWFSEEEMKSLELKREQEEEKRRMRATSFREKALMVMMDNRLYTRKEDLLKKDIPKPAFMLIKEEWEYNLDEYMAAQEYYAKVERLEVERAEFKKELEIELHQLIKINVEARINIDKKAEELFLLKQKVEENIRMEEIRLCRMHRQVLRRSTIQLEEERLSAMLKKLQDSLKSSQSLAAQLVVRGEKLSNRLDGIVESERLLEKGFRRDLGEVGNFFDYFMKSYKKRPKFPRAAERNPEIPHMVLQALAAPSIKLWGKENGDLGAMVAAALVEFDDPVQNPIGCPRSSWDRFVRVRKEKLVCEYETKMIAVEMSNLHKILDECKRREEELGNAIATVLTSATHEKDMKLHHFHNFEFQMCYPQGRVELQRYDRRSDFYNAAIIRQEHVTKSNDVIKKVSNIKFDELGKNILQHAELLRVEWKFKRATIKFNDIESIIKDLHHLRVSKEIIDFLHSSGNIREIQNHRILRLHKLQSLSGKFHQMFLDDQARLTKLLQEHQKRTKRTNSHLEKKIAKMNLDACEKVIDLDVAPAVEQEKAKQRRMALVMKLGEAMRKVHQYVQDIDLLERELARQCHKTFPIF